MLFHAMAGAMGLLTAAGLVYSALALLGARSFAHHLRAMQATLGDDPSPPGVTLLKPLKGADDALFAALASHCRQQYDGPFEILCGVRSADDPASRVVAALAACYPQMDLKLIVCPEELGTSGKVATLAQLLPHARYAHLLVNDADIHVGPDYLARIMQCFRTPARRKGDRSVVGMVTAPYVGRAHPLVETGSMAHPQANTGDPAQRRARPCVPLWSRLEALGIATEFFPGVLTARLLERGLRFGLGSTLAMRADALQAIGGFRPLLESLADDYELGARIARAGFRVELAGEVVATTVPAYRARGFLEHQLRWARSTRDSRRLGYLGLGVTFCLPWAMLAALASGFALWSVALLSLALAARVAVALTVGVGLLGDAQVLRDLWLLPVRDAFGLFFWLWSFAGDTVVWRGERYTLRNGRLEPVER